MKPIRRTQVITIMATCAISIAMGQQAAGGQQAQGPQQAQTPQATQPAQADQADFMDRDMAVAVRQAASEARQAASEARAAMRQGAVAARQADRAIDRDAVERAMEKAQAALADSDVWRVPLAQLDNVWPALAMAQDIAPKAPLAPMPPMPAMPVKAFRFGDSGSYESGKSALDNHNYDRAVEIFDRVINARNPSTHIEGAYYWKAYALNKQGKRDEALAALNELATKYPQSGWTNDANALKAEVQQAKGQPVSPENQADEDLKLYAINALINSDPERAVPLLDGLLSNPKMSPKLKERALFVLAQSRSDKAHEIVGRYAKGGSNPDLQLAAVQYLGTYRSKESRQLLSEIYASANDVNVKRSVLRSYERSRDVDHLASIAKSEQNVDLRREAIRELGNIRDDQSVAALVADYGTESDREIKMDILSSLRNQQAAKQIIDCARKETDLQLKQQAVRMLSEMHSKEATDFLMEILK